MLRENHFVIGSCALILSGIPIVKTADLDLFVSQEDAENLKLVWASRLRVNYIPADTHLFRSNFGRFDFGDLDVEIMGGLEVIQNDEWKSLQIKNYVEILLGEQKIKIPTLQEQRRIFYFFGREKDKLKAQLIERYLQ